jgi:hypothetical protein
MENEKKENKFKRFVLDHRASICMAAGIMVGTVLGGVAIMHKHADGIKLDKILTKSTPMEDGLPSMSEVFFDFFSKADSMYDRAADKAITIDKLPEEVDSLVEYIKDLGGENSELVGTIIFTKN